MTTRSRQISTEAYRASAENRAKLRNRVLAVLHEYHCTDDWMEQILDSPHQSVSSTRRHLVKAGLVEATGDLQFTRSGRRAQVWRLTPAGEALFGNKEE